MCTNEIMTNIRKKIERCVTEWYIKNEKVLFELYKKQKNKYAK